MNAEMKKRAWRKADGSRIAPAPKPAPASLHLPLFGSGPNADDLKIGQDRWGIYQFSRGGLGADGTPAERAMRFMQGLQVPEGPNAGQLVQLAPFQRQFIENALAPDTAAAVLSIGRGNGKSALTAGLALGGLLGVWDDQPRREIICAARTRDQGRIIWDFVAGFAASLPPELQRLLIYRRAPRLEIEFTGDGGGHVLRVIAADGKSALGGAPTMAILDERGHWALDRGDELLKLHCFGVVRQGPRQDIPAESKKQGANGSQAENETHELYKNAIHRVLSLAARHIALHSGLYNKYYQSLTG